MPTNLKLLSWGNLENHISTLGMKRYKSDQIIKWIYKRGITDIDSMTDLSKHERENLKNSSYISHPEIEKTLTSADGTKKFLFRLEDGNNIESVLIQDKDRATICVSTQVGCGLACKFCLTGKSGFIRDLEAYEIIDQIISIRKLSPRPLTNIVMMGMGEPLLNFVNVKEAIKIITSEKGLEISPKNITISTAGIIPQILEISKISSHLNLAISLNATTEETRDDLMPINKKYPLTGLIKTCRQYPLPDRKLITFEYVLLKGVNDSSEDAHRLSYLLKGIKSKVNLIPYNESGEAAFTRPEEPIILKFQEILIKNKIITFIRKSKGQDISAACGQLKY